MFRIITFISILYFTLARSHLAIINWLPPNLNPIATMLQPRWSCAIFYCLFLSLSSSQQFSIWSTIWVQCIYISSCFQLLPFHIDSFIMLLRWCSLSNSAWMCSMLKFIQFDFNLWILTAVTFSRYVTYFTCHFKLVWSDFYFFPQFALIPTENFPNIGRRQSICLFVGWFIFRFFCSFYLMLLI